MQQKTRAILLKTIVFVTFAPMKRIILITGGQRSGKSEFAERLTLSISSNPVYIATAHIWDDDFRHRVDLHKKRRGHQWTNIEEEKFLGNINIYNKVALIDCLTLWCTNFYFDKAQENDSPNIEEVLVELKAEFDKFTSQDAVFIFVTNEIGWGGTSENEVQRRFTDLLGWFNQYVASKADDVYMTVSGIPVKIK